MALDTLLSVGVLGVLECWVGTCKRGPGRIRTETAYSAQRRFFRSRFLRRLKPWVLEGRRPVERETDHVFLQAETITSFRLPKRWSSKDSQASQWRGGRVCLFCSERGDCAWTDKSCCVSLRRKLLQSVRLQEAGPPLTAEARGGRRQGPAKETCLRFPPARAQSARG